MRALLARPDTPVLVFASALLLVGAVAGHVYPPVFFMLLAAVAGAGVIFLAFRMPIAFSVGWLLITGMTLEMTMRDLAGDDAFQPTIAVVKAAGIGLAVICALRYGPRADLLSPAWAFAFILGSGFVHGLHPDLTPADSIRSAIGSAAPFAFGFCRVPRAWADAIIRAVQWCPIIAVTACLPLTAAGIRPMFVDSGGLRLAGLGHPAFLATICLPAIYACLIALYREGRGADLRLLIANALILILTGARAPFASAVFVTAICLLTVPSEHFQARTRLALILVGLALLPIVALLAGALDDVRLFNIMFHDTGDLSGRTLLWPEFEEAASQSPWFGWGTGAGNFVIPSDGRIARAMHTWAAHNEYLRIQVEGGIVGVLLLIGLTTAWMWRHTARLRLAERRIMRMAMLAFAAHAITDNLLISTPACVFFTFAIAVFARPAAD